MRVQADVTMLSSPVMLLVCHCSSLLALGSPQYTLDTRKHFPHLLRPGEQQLPIYDGQDMVREFNTAGGVISTGTEEYETSFCMFSAPLASKISNVAGQPDRGKWSVSEGTTGMWFSAPCGSVRIYRIGPTKTGFPAKGMFSKSAEVSSVLIWAISIQ